MGRQNFKVMAYQTNAVNAAVGCFEGQPHRTGFEYRVDPGRQVAVQGRLSLDEDVTGHRNPALSLDETAIFDNIQFVQRRQNLPLSETLVKNRVAPINLDVEMETGTGKTYCYIKTMFEMNRRYGWSKFIVVVPSIAIREGVKKTFEDTADHFLADYGKRARFFIYSSKNLHQVESFASDVGINVMIINVQAFNASGTGGKDARRIFSELDEFQSRRPIDVIRAVRPILILDEPQKMEGAATQRKLEEFDAMMLLRYSATHNTTHNLIHRLDALDAYNQKLVKKIAVRGISVRGLPGTDAYLYLESIEVSKSKPPVARLELEIKQQNGIRRQFRKISKGDNLFVLSNELEEYRDRFIVTDIDAKTNTITFENGHEIDAGEAINDQNEMALRRIQIRETIKAHFEKERSLHARGIKVLSLFFIDAVANYRQYDENGDQVKGDYAKIFEEEYAKALDAEGLLADPAYKAYIDNVGRDVSKTHNGYFSIDKKKLVDPTVKKTGEMKGESDDTDAYDLILKDKDRLLSLNEPTRFLFSHSALREGWDNPNVFVICTLKYSDNQIGRRQEVGRGLRICVNREGDRQDHPAIVHDINVLTVVANESYEEFVKGFQKELREGLASRPRKATEDYFLGKVLLDGDEEIAIDAAMAKTLYRYLLKNDYTDDDDHITDEYHRAKQDDDLAALPDALAPYAAQVFGLVDSVFLDAAGPDISNDRKGQINNLNDNFHKKEFQALWGRINKKAAYKVEFDTAELIEKCVKTVDKELNVSKMQYVIKSGEQADQLTYDSVQGGTSFGLRETESDYESAPVSVGVRYDLIGKITENTKLTRRTITDILRGINIAKFGTYKLNPEAFIGDVSRLVNEQKATMVIQHLRYNMLHETFGVEIFTQDKTPRDLSKAMSANNHVYDYVVTDSGKELAFAENLDISSEVVVYAKLPNGFFIPTPVGDYNPDWAVAFKEGDVKHIYFVAETKGSMSSMQLREIEKSKIECARQFFMDVVDDGVKYDVVDTYERLLDIVKAA
ncbi:restriction endonuclease [Anderseniella sp. Alg231-50]|uniref:restriction endonuclease n=1 Tax=Anderseniella sp. Alg231-50 TaxID=1922226 RepID=UPI000D559F53